MKRAVGPAIESLTVPAPVGGLNTVVSGAAVPEGDCIQLFNMVSSEHGLRSRLGYQQHSVGNPVNGSRAISTEVRSLLPYTGSAADGSLDRLFVVRDTGIYDASSSTSNYATGSPLGNCFWDWSGTISAQPLAGYGTAQAFTTSAGHFLVYCDELTGMYLYTESTDTWTRVTEGVGPGLISGVDPTTFCFVLAWKSRLWFVQRNTAKVWYLAAGAVTGAATQLNLDRSAQFRQGGGVRCLANWTGDGGAGIDDRLVAVSDGGEVAVYEGTDPASADTFKLKGTWHVGAIVAGRRVASSIGGDVLLLTKAGIRPLSQLVTGGDGQGTYQTAKVANLFNALTLARSELPNWAIHIHPEDNTLLVLVPQYLGAATEQLAQSLWNRSWSRYRDLPIVSACVWRNKLYFGDTSGNVWVNTGYVDNVTLAAPTSFTAVQWAVLTPFRNSNGRMKQVQLVRPTVLAEQYNADFNSDARYGYNLSELSSVSASTATGASSWDVGTWDSAVWANDYTPTQRALGASGFGADVAISVRGRAISRTVLVGMDVFFTQGGPL